MFTWQRWFYNDLVTLSVSCYPHHWGMHWRDNGGRYWRECWDTTLALGPWQFNLTLWRIGPLSLLLRWLPHNRPGKRHGLLIGWS